MNMHKNAKLTPLGRERRACLSRQAGRRQSLSNLKTARPEPAIMDA